MKDIKTDSINELLDHYSNELGIDKSKAEINIAFNEVVEKQRITCFVYWEWDEQLKEWVRIAECA